MSADELFPEPEPELSAGQRWLAEQRAAAAAGTLGRLARRQADEHARRTPPRTAEARAAGRNARDIAVEAVDADDTDAAWKIAALDVLDDLGRRLDDLTTDDVWHRLDELGVDPPHDSRAMGPLMRHAAKAGLVELTDAYRPSTRRHMTPIRVWTRPT